MKLLPLVSFTIFLGTFSHMTLYMTYIFKKRNKQKDDRTSIFIRDGQHHFLEP